MRHNELIAMELARIFIKSLDLSNLAFLRCEIEKLEIGKSLRQNFVPGSQQGSQINFQIFEAMRRVYEQGKPVDLITLAEQLRQSGILEEVGSYSYLTECWEAAG